MSKRILISQPKPQQKNNHYANLEKEYNVELEFRKFFQIEGVPSRELRKQRLNFTKYTAVIFTSRVAVDHFFRVASELRYNVPGTMKYFCSNETISQYLSKYIVYRKRKIFFANGHTDDLVSIISEYPDEQFLFPVADSHKNTLYNKLKRRKLKVTKSVFYKIVSSDLSDLTLNHDIIVLFSPSGVKSLLDNFPEVVTNKDIVIAASGPETAKAVTKAGLKVGIKAPTEKHKSIINALESYLDKEVSV